MSDQVAGASTPAASGGGGQSTGAAPNTTPSAQPSGTESGQSTGTKHQRKVSRTSPASTSQASDASTSAKPTESKASDSNPPPADPKEKPKADAPPEKRKLTVAGKIRELSEEDFVRYAQKGLFADEQMELNSKARKELENFQAGLKNDPKGFIKELAKQTGLSPEEVGEWLLNEHVDEQMAKKKELEMTDEQREQKRKDDRLKEFEDNDAKKKKEAADAKRKEEVATHEKRYLEDITTALDKIGYLKGEGEMAEALRDEAVGHAATYLIWARQNGYQAEIGDVVDYVHSKTQQQFHNLLEVAASDEKSFGSFLPEKFIKAVGQFYIKKIRGSQETKPQERRPSKPTMTEDRPKKFSELQRERRGK